MNNKIILQIEEGMSKRVVNINEQSYKYFISNDSLPKSHDMKYHNIKTHWKTMSEKQRLNFHLNRIANGNKFTCEIL